jgi:hypothetical protein
MKSEPRYDGTGVTISEYLSTVAHDLMHDDSVGMWKIVPAGRGGFGLSGVQLDEFIRSYISVLIQSGARPVRAVDLGGGMWEWREQKQYGNNSDQIGTMIVAEWRSAGAPDPEWGWLRFELSQYINRPCRKNQTPRSLGA